MGGRFVYLLFILLSLTSFTSASILGGKKTPLVEERHDSLGTVSTALQCRGKYFHKMVIYATIRQGCMLLHKGQTIRGECKKSRFKLQQTKTCQNYPQKFEPTAKLNFKSYSRSGRELFSYPLLQFGEIFDGRTSPGLERVIFDKGCNAAGATTADTLRGFTEACVINRSPPKQGFFDAHY